MKNNKVYLIGMPGSGKSTLAKGLSEKMNINWVDMDEMIVEKETQDIPTIFTEKGEDYFREIEKNILHTTLLLREKIIATGGGAPCFFDNMDVMLENGTVIYLEVSAKDLLDRVRQQEGTRPLLNDKNDDLLQQITTKLAHREKFYKQAHFTIKNEGNVIEEVANLLENT